MVKKSHTQAFSLIEVTIAIVILSFGLIALLGLLAGGYAGLRVAMDTSIQTQLTQGISSELQTVNWSYLTNTTSGFQQPPNFPRYYDRDGDSTTNSPSARYIVTLNSTSSVIPSAVTNAQALRVNIIIVGQAGSGPAFSNSHPVLVVNNGN